MRIIEKWDQEILSIMRIVAAFMFTLHGTQKILGFPIESRGPFELWTLAPGLAGVMEMTLGPILMIGLFTRPIAFVLSGLMAFAYFIAHAPQSFYPIANGGDDAVLYCFVFLYIAAVGGGRWSVDALRRK